MFKKISVIFLTVLMLLGTSACNLKSKDGSSFKTNEGLMSETSSVTLHHNTFKDKIPKPDFKETPKEQYVDGEGYFFSVVCTEKEFENYSKKLKKIGFDNNLVEATGYFYAKDSEGYYAELVYKNGILTATIDR